MKNLEYFKIQVAKENGMNKLVTGHAVALFDEAAERYANYKAEIAHDELKYEIIGLLPFHGGDVLPHVINNIPNPYKNARHN